MGQARSWAAVADDQDVDTVGDGGGRIPAEPVQRMGKALTATRHLVAGIQDAAGEAARGALSIQPDDGCELRLGQDRMGQVDLSATARLGIQQVSLWTHRGAHGGDELLANGIQRRVGDLGEQLLEVVVEGSVHVRENRDRSVRSHGADRPLAVADHRGQEHLECLVGVSEGLLALDERVLVGRGRVAGRQVVQLHEVGVQPLPIGTGRCQAGLDLVVPDDPPLAGVDEEHPARLQAPLLDDLAAGDVHDADLAGHHDQVVGGHPVAAGAQSVAVQDRTDDRAIREGDRGRPVPGLHERCVVLVEGPALVGHLRMVLPRFRDHHQDGLGQRVAAQGQELECLVEARCVAGPRRADRKESLDVSGDQVGCHQGLAGTHPVPVSLHRVDLAVVRNHPVRVGERPGGEGVRGEPGVHQHQCALQALVGEVGEELCQLEVGEHPLVDDRPGRERREVDARGRRCGALLARPELVLHPLADHVRQSIQDDARRSTVGALDAGQEHLAKGRLRSTCGVTDHRIVDR